MRDVQRTFDYYDVRRMTRLPDSEVNEIMRVYGFHEYVYKCGKSYRSRLVITESDLNKALKRRNAS